MKGDISNDTATAAKENRKLPFKPLPTPAKSSQQPTKVDTSLGTSTFYFLQIRRFCITLLFQICVLRRKTILVLTIDFQMNLKSPKTSLRATCDRLEAPSYAA
jgi:hypothetical protein